MGSRRGRRAKSQEKLNFGKVLFVLIILAVIAMIILSLRNLLSPLKNTGNKVNSMVTYFSVYDNGKWGVIDNDGNQIIECIYSDMISIPDPQKPVFICTEITDYVNEVYLTKVLNEKGEEILTDFSGIEPLENSNEKESWYETNLLKYSLNGKYGLINLDGKVILDAIYNELYVLPGVEKSIIIEKDGMKGLVNSSLGEVIIEPKYTDILSCSDSFQYGYIVKNSSNKCGIIGIDKNVILEEKYDDILNIASDTYYVVKENKKLEIVDNKGNIVLNSGFESVRDINVDNFIIQGKEGKYGVISKDNTKVLETEFDDLKFAFQNCYIVKKDDKYGIMDSEGNQKISFSYEDISYVSEADFFIAENSNFTTDVIDRNMNVKLNDIIITDLNLEDGYLRVREGEEYKYYNFKFEEKTNKEILSTNTLFLVKKFGKFGYENKKGELIVDYIYDDAKEQNSFGYCAVKRNGLWGVLKVDGTVILEPSVNLDDYLYVNFVSVWHRYNDLKANFYVK